MIVGALSTLVHVSVYTLALGFGLQPITANMLGVLAAVLFSFLGHYHFSFEMSGRYFDYAGKFALTSLSGLAVSSAIMQVSMRSGMQPFGALLIVVLTIPTLSYAINRFWAFSDSAQRVKTVLRYSDNLHWHSSIVWHLWILDDTLLNHDSSWYLLATARWMNGAELYSDILEINPPLSFYLTIPAVTFAKYFGFDSALIFRLQFVIGATVSAAVSTAILKQACSLSPTRSFIFTAFANTALLLSPISDFGQREHLMLIFSLPLMMLLIVTGSCENQFKRLIIPITLVGMLGIALKPHFLLPVALVFAVNLVYIRSWKTLFSKIHLTILVALLSYLAFIALVHPGYLGFMVPLGIAVYGYSDANLWSIAIDMLPIIGSVLLLFACTCPGELERQMLIRSFAILLGFGLAFLVQFKGWSYQLIPVRSFAIIGIGLVLALGVKARRGLGMLAVLTLVATLWFGLVMQLKTGPYKNYITISLKRALDEMEGTQSLMFLSTNVSSGFPLVRETGLEWASRFPTLWLVPSIVDNGDPEICVPGQQSFCSSKVLASTFLRESVTEDLIRFNADLVIVDVREKKSYVQNPFDYLEFMKKDDRFRELWIDFKLVRSVGTYDIWRRR